MKLDKKRILLTIPISLLDDADGAALAQRISRGEFIRQSIARGLAGFTERGGTLPPPLPQHWLVGNGRQ